MLVVIDRPRKGATPEHEAVIKNYAVQGFPTVILMLADGTPYAITGYQRGGTENYNKHLDSLLEQKKVVVDLMEKAAKSSDKDKEAATAAFVDKCIELELPVVWVQSAADLVKGDSDNKKGYFAKYGVKLALHYQCTEKNDEARKLLESIVKLQPKGYEAYFHLALLVADEYKRKETVDLLAKALENLSPAKETIREWATAHAVRANCLFNLYQFDDAKAELKAILDNEASKGFNANFRGQLEAQLAACDPYKEFYKEEMDIRAKEEKQNDNPLVEIETSKGKIKLELFENQAPNTVANFISLVEKKFYDGILFHRVIGSFMVQTGDPLSKDDKPDNDGSGGPGYTFKDEVSGNYRKHFVGSLSMANAGPDTNGSQFFITHVATSHLNGKHTVFGRVLEGQEVVNKIAQGDKIVSAKVVRKRSHEYKPEVVGEKKEEEKKPEEKKPEGKKGESKDK